jgi:hypothetical protein
LRKQFKSLADRPFGADRHFGAIIFCIFIIRFESIMKFIASDEQLKQIIFNAIQASKPWTNSLGVQNSMEPLSITPQHIKLNKSYLQFDYVYGRCVKLYIYQVENDSYEIEHEPTPERQTWVCKYPTNEALIKSVVS